MRNGETSFWETSILWMEEVLQDIGSNPINNGNIMILHHQKDGWNPIHNGRIHLSAGARFPPSTQQDCLLPVDLGKGMANSKFPVGTRHRSNVHCIHGNSTVHNPHQVTKPWVFQQQKRAMSGNRASLVVVNRHAPPQSVPICRKFLPISHDVPLVTCISPLFEG